MVPSIVPSHINTGIPYTSLVETEKRHPHAFPNMPKLNSHIMYPATSSIHKMKTIFPGKGTAKKNECLGEGSEMRSYVTPDFTFSLSYPGIDFWLYLRFRNNNIVSHPLHLIPSKYVN